MASRKRDNYLMVAAIDFGTTYSGYAFSARHEFQRDPTKVSLKACEDPTSTMMYNKTSTCILLNKEKEFSKFGFDAEAKFLDLILDNDHENLYFFRRFKMSLYELKVINIDMISRIFLIIYNRKLIFILRSLIYIFSFNSQKTKNYSLKLKMESQCLL